MVRPCLKNVLTAEVAQRRSNMAKLVFGMNQSLDGYIDHEQMVTGPELFRHWIEHVRDLTASIYGRRMYEAMALLG